jgi:hypothetical protein
MLTHILPIPWKLRVSSKSSCELVFSPLAWEGRRYPGDDVVESELGLRFQLEHSFFSAGLIGDKG